MPCTTNNIFQNRKCEHTWAYPVWQSVENEDDENDCYSPGVPPLREKVLPI